MRKFLLCLVPLLAFLTTSCESKYKYESVANDPLNVQLYTLDNGLKVYLSVNKDAPRISTYIGVRVGSKNDPAETTGLAHYFEHMMFKGTKQFGTTDYEAEEPLLDQIEQLFETYRKTTEEKQRKEIYARIDSVSQEASKYAILNEYDKLMAEIGSRGSNAFTSSDITAYSENIPSNELETWAKIQADRFKNPVLRIFHTELEIVYEEYNMSLTSDGTQVYNTLMAELFPHHPYGKQTTIGDPEHLKNPSITNIKRYFETYYVPNNMAIVMVGDFDPDEAMEIIEKYFGDMKPKDIPELSVDPETPITAPIVREVIGLEAENITIAYRMPGANTKDAAIAEIVDYMLKNGKAGLMDLNLIQQQRVLEAGSSLYENADYGVFLLEGTPKDGQTLDEVKALLLEQINILKRGEFDDDLIEAVVNNFKLRQYSQQGDPDYAAYMIVNSFGNGVMRKDEVEKIDYQSQLTKDDIVAFCNKYLNDNYVVVYKREGNPEVQKIEKPEITPVSANRESESKFLVEIQSREVEPIEPVFIDYSKDLTQLTAKHNIPVLYVKNDKSPLFSITYVFDMGNKHDKALGMAAEYLAYLGTSKHTAEEIKSEFYKMACSFGVSSGDDRTNVYVNGLDENFEKAVALLEERLAEAVVDMEGYNNFVANTLKSRSDLKLSQDYNFSKLREYAKWGSKSPGTNILSEQELKMLNPQELVDKIKDLKNFEHTILYYGPRNGEAVVEFINENHAIGEQLKPIPEPTKFVEQEITTNKVLLAYYDAPQVCLGLISKGSLFDDSITTVMDLYNLYFGGGMNSIVHQEMRESRALAYAAGASYLYPLSLDESYYSTAFIMTQNDKMSQAVDAFNEILNNMPQSQKAFDIGKEKLISYLRTERVQGESILWSYLHDKKFGRLEGNWHKKYFEEAQALTLDDIVKFQEKYIKNKPKTYCILGDWNDVDLEYLKAIGPVTKLSQEEIFGY